ncbi:formin-like protein 5 [Homarus americanus]|uniref:formin-like protein 5 n=1 Tax=Homarus americanus TaxID=6706 RepID=UPI001C47AEFC|nr:formin-like protein 5 [Homarus americanus]XP_042225820.1 formin-like protein 5 [Homarus americanus]XP_042225821.1 formin-like protein 5 [Homarus americanus]
MSMGWGGMVVGPGWWGAGGGGKSAVQLLQESKSRYVKSDHVLGSSQTPARPERLHISSNPNIFLSAPSHTLHVSRPSPAPERRHALADHNNIVNLRDHPSLAGLSPPRPVPLSGPASLGAQPPPLPARSPRVTPRPKVRGQEGHGGRCGSDLRRSLSHGPGDRNDNVQMKLRRLLNTDSQENLASLLQPPSDVKPKIPPPAPRGGIKASPPGTYRAEPATVTTHKSLPDLNRSSSPAGETDSECGTSGHRRPSCPGAIPSISIAPEPPPRPPRMFRDPPPPPEHSTDRPPARPPLPHRLREPSIPRISRSGASAGTLMPTDGRRSSDSDVSAYGGTGSGVNNNEEGRRRPILRSRSDVTHERGRWEEDLHNSLAPLDLEAFFESMGLDSATHRQLTSPPNSPHSSPVYFEEVSSEESGPLGGRRGSSDSDDGRGLSGPGPGPPLPLRGTGEPSIVEKNARVIKWLFNCQKAQGTYVSRVSSTKS